MTKFHCHLKILKYQKDDSIFEINGDLFGELPRSISGQISFLHNNQLSTIAVNSVEGSYRFSLNLHLYEWLNFIPDFDASPIKDLAFQINALGELQADQSNIRGSFSSNSLFFKSLSINQNKGSFHFQSKKNIGTLTLNEFLHPLIDEEHPIQINLQQKSLAVPRFFLSHEILKIETFKVTNLIIENLFLSFDNFLPKYSGFVRDLDLNDLHFKEIINLSGDFSGYGDKIKFLVSSNSSVLRNFNQNFIPVSISGVGNFSGSVFDLKARIKNKSAGIDLALKMDQELDNLLSIELKGHDISKDLITFSLPKSLKGVSSYVDENINLGSKKFNLFQLLNSQR